MKRLTLLLALILVLLGVHNAYALSSRSCGYLTDCNFVLAQSSDPSSPWTSNVANDCAAGTFTLDSPIDGYSYCIAGSATTMSHSTSTFPATNPGDQLCIQVETEENTAGTPQFLGATLAGTTLINQDISSSSWITVTACMIATAGTTSGAVVFSTAGHGGVGIKIANPTLYTLYAGGNSLTPTPGPTNTPGATATAAPTSTTSASTTTILMGDGHTNAADILIYSLVAGLGFGVLSYNFWKASGQ